LADTSFTGPISGSGGLTFIGKNNFSDMEVPFVLSGSNTFTGTLEIQRGSVYLNNANALVQGNTLLLDPASNNNARLFLYGNNASVSNLTSSGAGKASIANGNAATGIGTQLGTGTLTVSETTATTYAGTLVDEIAEYNKTGKYKQGPLALVKTGSAALTLSGTSTYTGGTTVRAGTLIVSGSIMGSTTVASGATLAGTGTAGTVTVSSGGAITVDANHASTGTLTVQGALNIAVNGNYNLDLNSTLQTADLLNATGTGGTLTLSGQLNVNDLSLAASVNTNLIIAKCTSLSGTFSNYAQGALVDNGLYTIDYGKVNPNAVTLVARSKRKLGR
jgi:autotransporter-associated beta strand protein